MAIVQRRSQVTIFLILIIVILLSVFLIIAANKGYFATKAEKEISKASELTFSSNPVKSFIEQCLFLVSRDSITKIGQQSGFLFASQGSTTPDYDSSDEGKSFAFYNGIKVTFLGNDMQ